MIVKLPEEDLARVYSLAVQAGVKASKIVSGMVRHYLQGGQPSNRERRLVEAVEAAVGEYRKEVPVIDWDEVRRLKAEGGTLRSLAARYGVSPSTIHSHL